MKKKLSLDKAYAKIKMNEIMRVPEYCTKDKLFEDCGLDITVLPYEYDYWFDKFYPNTWESFLEKIDD